MLLSNKHPRWGILVFVAVGVLPLLLAVGYAALYSVGLLGIVSRGFTLRHWQEVLTAPEVGYAFGFSAYIASVALLLSVTLALLLTVHYKRYLNNGLFSYIVFLPLAIPGVVAAFFTFHLLSKAGLLSRLAFHAGWIDNIQDFPDLVNDAYGIGIILTFMVLTLPFFLLLFSNVYRNERIEDLEVLAGSLGASRRQAILQVSAPILLKKTFPVMLLYFIFIFSAYEVPLILGRESPQMISVLIIREMNQFALTKIPEGYAVALVYTGIVISAAVVIFSTGRRTYEA